MFGRDLKADRGARKLYSREKRQLQVRCAQTEAAGLGRLDAADQVWLARELVGLCLVPRWKSEQNQEAVSY